MQLPNFRETARATAEPELKYLPSGTPVATFTIAKGYSYPDKNREGKWIDKTDFIDCKIFGKAAEGLAKRLKKGDLIEISGNMKTDRWQDKEDNWRQHSYILVTTSRIVLHKNRPTEDVVEDVELKAEREEQVEVQAGDETTPF